jgi:pimeloyl-ACP methyl ester carboxylesterase
MPIAQVNGTTLHYECKGTGTPIVCIHPILLTGEVFNYQRASLSDRYRIITFDIRGHGQSPFSEDPVTYAQVAADIRALLELLDIPQAYLCGYSVGGQIALEAMLADPDRYLGAILISSMSELTDSIHRSLVWMTLQLCGLQGMRLLSVLDALGNADKVNTFKALYTTSCLGDFRNFAQYHEQVLSCSCTERLRHIRKPVLLLYGQKSTRYHSYGRVLHRGLSNSSLHFIRSASHQIPTKNAADLEGLLRLWLTDQSRIQAGRKAVADQRQQGGGLNNRLPAAFERPPESRPIPAALLPKPTPPDGEGARSQL